MEQEPRIVARSAKYPYSILIHILTGSCSCVIDERFLIFPPLKSRVLDISAVETRLCDMRVDTTVTGLV